MVWYLQEVLDWTEEGRDSDYVLLLKPGKT